MWTYSTICLIPANKSSRLSPTQESPLRGHHPAKCTGSYEPNQPLADDQESHKRPWSVRGVSDQLSTPLETTCCVSWSCAVRPFCCYGHPMRCYYTCRVVCVSGMSGNIERFKWCISWKHAFGVIYCLAMISLMRSTYE